MTVGQTHHNVSVFELTTGLGRSSYTFLVAHSKYGTLCLKLLRYTGEHMTANFFVHSTARVEVAC
jgi:hypothetical protein